MRVWETSTICDVLTNSILQNLKHIKDMDKYIRQAVELIIRLEVKLLTNDIAVRFKTIPLEPKLPVVNINAIQYAIFLENTFYAKRISRMRQIGSSSINLHEPDLIAILGCLVAC